MNLSTARRCAALGALTLALAPAAAAATSHVKLWQNKAKTLDCGIEIPLPGKHPSQILCSAVNLPAPPSKVGDPFVQISRHGHPHIVRVGDDEFVGHTIVTLKPGTKWSALGVTCTIQAKKAKCTNASGHGFTIAKHLYKPF